MHIFIITQVKLVRDSKVINKMLRSDIKITILYLDIDQYLKYIFKIYIFWIYFNI